MEIRWYALIISLGIVLGVILARRRAERFSFQKDDIYDIALVAVPVAILCARVYYVAFEWESYAGDFWAMINIRAGGLAIHGGVIGGVLVSYLVCRKKNLPYIKGLDLFAPSIILGQAIGRWGNFMNNEAHGGPTNLPWAIEVNGEMVHPTFFYESMGNFLVLVFLLYYDRHLKKADGEVFLLYGILYSLVRLVVEGFRTDSLYIGGFKTAQVLSLAIIFVFGTIFVRRRRKCCAKPNN